MGGVKWPKWDMGVGSGPSVPNLIPSSYTSLHCPSGAQGVFIYLIGCGFCAFNSKCLWTLFLSSGITALWYWHISLVGFNS